MAKSQTPSWKLHALLSAGVLAALASLFFLTSDKIEVLTYSDFLKQVEDRNVADVAIGEDVISGTLKTPLPDGARRFSTLKVDQPLADRLSQNDVKVVGSASGAWWSALLGWLVPLLAFYLLWRLASPGSGGLGGLMTVGRSSAKIYAETDVKVTFKDVAGIDEAKAELQETVAFLKDPASFGRLGAHAPKGVLLVGPPGTGKTLLARAVAGEAGVSFFSISGAEFIEMFVGVGAARVRDLFDRARQAAPAIIFIDELDSLGKSRAGANLPGGHDEREQTVNQLLAELDGFDPTVGVILLAATNRPEVLDPALLRPGRFDRQVLVDRPDRKGRKEILEVHARKVALSASLDLAEVAAMTTGFTGADLANLVNEAAIAATRRGGSDVTMADMSAALERIVAGIERRSRVLGPAERRRVAFHEMGHALVAANVPGVDPVLKVSIVPRGVGALGYTMQRPTEDRFLVTASELRGRIAVLMGGRAAEALTFDGDVSTGAADDLQRATEVALDMITRFGMSEELGQRVYLPPANPFLGQLGVDRPNASEATQREVDLAVKAVVAEAFERAKSILAARSAELERGAQLLLERETLTAADFPPIAAQDRRAREAA
ncbi:ATP-dependent zinc metalloprotease FtsH [Hansschlegelia zhihuaiae]|uniref:ATP-dependent zinc metalloprotease FtsH n=1 Tax=Hansschlegelia zhihuaiae TaxID=405005 RepID=UPI003D16CFCB